MWIFVIILEQINCSKKQTLVPLLLGTNRPFFVTPFFLKVFFVAKSNIMHPVVKLEGKEVDKYITFNVPITQNIIIYLFISQYYATNKFNGIQ